MIMAVRFATSMRSEAAPTLEPVQQKVFDKLKADGLNPSVQKEEFRAERTQLVRIILDHKG